MKAQNIQTAIVEMQSSLLNFAIMLTSNRDQAYDLVQDTTLKVLDNQDKFEENTNFKGWVFTIMRNIFINNYRRASRAATVVDTSENLYQLNISQDSGFAAPESSYAVSEINAAIEALEDDYRIPFSMHVAGYKYQEIADKTNVPLGTVKSRIFAARKRLQEQFS